MKQIAIIGGGISGLSAAHTLERQRQVGMPLDYVLFEASSRFGGVIHTERVDNCVIEAGPDSFLTEKPWASDLCHELGIADQLIGSNDSQRKTYILLNEKLIQIPDGLAFMVPTKVLAAAVSPLFSLNTKIRILRELFHPRLEFKADESVASFLERHYGRGLVDRLADPLLCGVYGGTAARLSVRAVLPRFADMQARIGSLGKAMIQDRKRGIRGDIRPLLFTSLKNGMQQLVEAVVQQLPGLSLRSNVSIQSLHRDESGWNVSAQGKSERFDAVILAIPANAAAKLLDASMLDIASELNDIKYSSSVTVSVGYDQEVRSLLPSGFGFLVPRSEGKRILAATFVHNKFPDRAPDDRALIRCFLGGTRDEPVLDLSDEEVLRIVRNELQQILGITAEPLFARIDKWREAMAQYDVGHLERLAQIEQLRVRNQGLFFAGNAYSGIGVPDCVRSGKQAATDAMVALGMGASKTFAPS